MESRYQMTNLEESDNNVIPVIKLNERYKPTGVVELDLSTINSPPCRGNCQDSYAICSFVNFNCQDWICSNFRKSCNAGYTRVKIGNPIPTCYLCSGKLVLKC